MAAVPATLRAGALASQGVLAFALRQGRLLEARWFPDDVSLENAHFGGAPAADGPSPAERAFEAAAALSKTLRRAPDNDTLLALYALFKQASSGDVAGERPGMMDMVGRAKYDAWLARRGVPREQAMGEYVALVNKLKAAEEQTAELRLQKSPVVFHRLAEHERAALKALRRIVASRIRRGGGKRSANCTELSRGLKPRKPAFVLSHHLTGLSDAP